MESDYSVSQDELRDDNSSGSVNESQWIKADFYTIPLWCTDYPEFWELE